jgi:hypothetical protein
MGFAGAKSLAEFHARRVEVGWAGWGEPQQPARQQSGWCECQVSPAYGRWACPSEHPEKGRWFSEMGQARLGELVCRGA